MRPPASSSFLVLEAEDHEKLEQLLRECAPIVDAISRRVTYLPGMDRDDLHALGRVAVLEAMATHQKTRGTLHAWAARMVRWRVQEAIQDALREPAPVEFHDVAVEAPGVEDFDLTRCMTRLNTRQKQILSWRMEGQTTREIAKRLQVSQPRVMKQLQEITMTLRSTPKRTLSKLERVQ